MESQTGIRFVRENGLSGLYGVANSDGQWLDAGRPGSDSPTFRGWSNRECDAAAFADRAAAERCVRLLGLTDARAVCEDEDGEIRRWRVAYEFDGARMCEVVLARSRSRAVAKVKQWHGGNITTQTVRECDESESLSEWPGAADVE